MSLLTAVTLATGIWRATLLTPGGDLPFNFELANKGGAYTLTIMNGEERILLDDITIKDDSLIARFPVYESELRVKFTEKSMVGVFNNLTRTTNGTIPLKAEAGNSKRFISPPGASKIDISGKYAVTFSPGTKDSSLAVGVFKMNGDNNVTGTFLTPSGDYRYLEGCLIRDSLFLSNFNGVFVYLVKAKIVSGKLDGIFYYGTHGQEIIAGNKDANAALPDPEKLTTIKGGDGSFTFHFADADSNIVSLDDDRFKNKVVVIQILGSWCPNCLDESVYLADFYKKHKSEDFEIIGLSFEKTDDFNRAAANVKRLKQRLGMEYPVLVAANRSKIRETMPELENFIGFPTTIFLDKKHHVRKVHAGFSGPATGVEYEKFKDHFEAFVSLLLRESNK